MCLSIYQCIYLVYLYLLQGVILCMCVVCVRVFNFQPIAGSLSYVWERGCLLETAAVDLAYMDREAVRNASRRYAEPRQWGSAGGGTGISHRIKVSAPVISQPPGGDDDDVILPPPIFPLPIDVLLQ